MNDHHPTDFDHLYGESGIPAGSLEPACAGAPEPEDDSAAIGRALEESGFLPEMQHNDLFVEYYRKVAAGPGRTWDAYRRARFTLQTMNRAGCIEWPVKPPAASGPSAAGITEGSPADIEALLDHELSRPRFSRPYSCPTGSAELFDDYRVLSPSEIRDNRIVMLSVLGLIILAATGIFFAVSYRQPAIGAGAGAGATAVGIAVASRLARKWHRRFSASYTWLRTLACMAILFTGVARNAASSAYSQTVSLFGNIASGRVFGLTLALLLTLMTIAAHLKLNRTYAPSAGKTLGWVEALCLTFALGAFLFSATSGK